MKQRYGMSIYTLKETSLSKNTLLNMAENISEALTTSGIISTQSETKGIDLITEFVTNEFLGIQDEFENIKHIDVLDGYECWSNFGIGGPA